MICYLFIVFKFMEVVVVYVGNFFFMKLFFRYQLMEEMVMIRNYV